MSSTTLSIQDSKNTNRLRSAFTLLRRHPEIAIGLAIFAFWVIGAITAPVLHYNPLSQDINASLQSPNADHWWGADKLGRDILTRVLYGAQLTIPAGLIAVAFSLVIGTVIGAVAGYLGGLWDELLMRVTDVFFAFPSIILAMAIAAALGPSVRNAVITIAIISWPSYARVTRGQVLSVKRTEYVEAARSIGAPGHRILFRTILPNCIGPLIVLATLDLGNAILVFAGLSFLGLGPAPETPEWGRMIAEGIDYVDQWWVSVFPGLAIFSVVMALNFMGDGLRDVFDPRSQRGLRG
jgi:peptide/nickel transport system permease protein